MKKFLIIFSVIVISVLILLISYNYRDSKNPNTYYRVYLDGDVIGVIDSKEKLEKFIDAESENIKNKYKVDKVYAPEGVIIEELTSFDQELTPVVDVYRKIISSSDLTINGYQISIKNEDKTKTVYVTDEKIFKEATIGLIKTFVGSDRYEEYESGNQKEILTTGSVIKNIYVQDNLTIKKIHIPVSEKIYISASDLSQYLLYGDDQEEKEYTVKAGDTISSVALQNQMSTEELLIANADFSDKNNLLHVGQKVVIAIPSPQVSVVVEEYQVLDKESTFMTEERYDSDLYIGTKKVLQEGVNGIVRVSQNYQSINGNITYIEPIAREEIKQPINKIVLLGSQQIPYVGDLNNWAWPTMSGYTITDDFEWRTNPITKMREHHSGIDVSGLGYGSPIYAVNNGTVITKQYQDDYGYYVVVNHNNGYWTLYAHMSRFGNIAVGDTVARGQVLGYIGSTGWATGPHLHFEVWKDCNYCRINPFSLHR